MKEESPAKRGLGEGLRLFEGSIWLGLVTTTLAAGLLVWGGSPNAVELLTPQVGLWWRALAAYYLTAAAAVGLVGSLMALVPGIRALARILVQLASAWILLATVWLNRGVVTRLTLEISDSSVPGLVSATVVLCVLSLVVLAFGLFWMRPWIARVVLSVTLITAWFASTEASQPRDEQPLQFERVDSESSRRVLVIGLDGADWDFIDPLIERGELPNLARLRENGVWGELETIRPTRSGPIWTSVVTGVDLRRHGVINNSVERLRGSFHRLPRRLPLPVGLGLPWIENQLRASGRIAQSTVASFDRRVPAFWTIATVNESPVDFINWWASWPAEQIFGRMVSDRIHFWRLQAKGFDVGEGNVTYPEELIEDLSRLVMRPDQVTHEHALAFMDVTLEEFEEMKTTVYRHHRLKSEFKYFYSMFVSNLRLALELIETGRKSAGPRPDLFVLFRIIDQASHQAMQYSELVDEHLGSDPEEIAKYGRVVTQAYLEADKAVGMLVEAFGEGTVIVLSDHGFALAKKRRGQKVWDHIGGSPPDGIFVGAGEGLSSGRIEDLSIYDMMPLLLHLKGWPVARDFVREVPTQLFSGDFLEQRPVRTIDTYGSMTVQLPEEGGLVADEEMVERLRALGYID